MLATFKNFLNGMGSIISIFPASREIPKLKKISVHTGNAERHFYAVENIMKEVAKKEYEKEIRKQK